MNLIDLFRKVRLDFGEDPQSLETPSKGYFREREESSP
jgi:hypothetical protein